MTTPASPNRATRRRQAHPKGEQVLHRQPASMGSLSARRQQDSLKSPQPPTIGTSSEYGASADIAPDNFGSYDDSASAPAMFQGYRGKYGLLKTNIVTGYATVGLVLGGPSSPDGMLFLASAESVADAWIAWGKSDPRYMKVVNLIWGGALTTLIIAHMPLIAGIAANHGVKVPSLGALLQRKPALPDLSGAGVHGSNHNGHVEQPAVVQDDFMLHYQPLGAQAPTEDFGPPPSPEMDAPLRIYPDEGIPADVETQLRQLSHTTGVPYQQIRDQYLLETAQDRIAHAQRVVPAAGLGTPVTNPGS